jgi:hypothetical protein
MDKRIRDIIKSYKLDVEAITSNKAECNVNCKIAIETGNNEGYYVTVTSDNITYNLRTHNKNEALKILGCMLILLPNN